MGYLARLENNGNYWLHDNEDKPHFPVAGPYLGYQAVLELHQRLFRPSPTRRKWPTLPSATDSRALPRWCLTQFTEEDITQAITAVTGRLKPGHGGNLAITASPSSEFIGELDRPLKHTLLIVSPSTEHDNQRLARAIIGPLRPMPRRSNDIHWTASDILKHSPARGILIVGADGLFTGLRGKKLYLAQAELKSYANESGRPFILIGRTTMWHGIRGNDQLAWRFKPSDDYDLKKRNSP